MSTNGGPEMIEQIENLHQQAGYDFMAAAFEVYNELGSGFLKEVYQESLEAELTSRGLAFVSKTKIALSYKGRTLKKHYEADLLVGNEIIVEL